MNAKPFWNEALQAEVGLPLDHKIPLIGFIGRLEEQKDPRAPLKSKEGRGTIASGGRLRECCFYDINLYPHTNLHSVRMCNEDVGAERECVGYIPDPEFVCGIYSFDHPVAGLAFRLPHQALGQYLAAGNQPDDRMYTYILL